MIPFLRQNRDKLPSKSIGAVTVGLASAVIAIFLTHGTCHAGFLSSIAKSLKSQRYAFEAELGARVRDDMIKKHGLLENDPRVAMVKHIGYRLAGVCDRQDVKYEFYALNSEEVNAFAAPGGYIFVTRGLLDSVADENELAFVLSHEIGHVVRKHSLHEIEKSIALSSLLALFTSGKGLSREQWSNLVQAVVSLRRSKSNGHEADWQGVYNVKMAGFNPYGSVGFFKKLNTMDGGTSTGGMVEKIAAFFSTHPPTPQRIEKAVKNISEITVPIK